MRTASGIRIYKLNAYAKLNLYLDITGKRDDGYHLLETVMQSISLADEVTVVVSAGNGITLSVSREDIPTDGRNTAFRAAELFLEKAGASGSVCIDIEKRKPILSNVMGGLSGPAVFPVAVRMVYQVRKAVSVPILGMGGIRTGRDIVEMMLAGADAVAMGTVMFNDPTAPVKALAELNEWLDAHGVKSVTELSGAVLTAILSA